MIKVYGNGCVRCNHVINELQTLKIPFTYHRVADLGLQYIKDMLGDDYHSSMTYPLIFCDGKLIKNINVFMRGLSK